jgi:hypothetical protein
MNTNLRVIGAGLIACAISFSIGKFSSQSQTDTKQTEKIDEKKVTDTVRVTDKKETTLPDGTKIVETNTTTERKTNSDKISGSSKETKTENRPNWRVNVLYFPFIASVQDTKYTVDIQRRILSQIYLGVAATSDKQIGVSIGIGF